MKTFLVILISACLGSPALSPSTAAQALIDAKARRFTLNCKSSFRNNSSKVTSYIVDVNLDLKTYYTNYLGSDEIISDDGNMITFGRHHTWVHGTLVLFHEYYFRRSGHYFFFGALKDDELKDGKVPPDAICMMAPPRQNFMADAKYHAP